MAGGVGEGGRSNLDKAEDRLDDLAALGAQQREHHRQQLWRGGLQLWRELVQQAGQGHDAGADHVGGGPHQPPQDHGKQGVQTPPVLIEPLLCTWTLMGATHDVISQSSGVLRGRDQEL